MDRDQQTAKVKDAFRKFARFMNEQALKEEECKAREYELKAGKTFRRTSKHVKKAARARAAAERLSR